MDNSKKKQAKQFLFAGIIASFFKKKGNISGIGLFTVL